MSIGVYKHYSHQGFQKGNKGFGTKESRIRAGKKISKSKKGKKLSETHKEAIKRTHGIKQFGFKKGHKINLGKRFVLGKHWKLSKEQIEKRQGENSFYWKGGISFEPYSVDWTETLRRSIRERDNYTCQLCSQYGNMVHHIDYDKHNCNPVNLITLCRKCHSKTNMNRDYWLNYFK